MDSHVASYMSSVFRGGSPGSQLRLQSSSFYMQMHAVNQMYSMQISYMFFKAVNCIISNDI